MIKKILATSLFVLLIIANSSSMGAQSLQQVNPATQNPQDIGSGNIQPTGNNVQQGPSQDIPLESTQELLAGSSNVSLQVNGVAIPPSGLQGLQTGEGATQTRNNSYLMMWVAIIVLGSGFLGFTYWQFSRPSKNFN